MLYIRKILIKPNPEDDSSYVFKLPVVKNLIKKQGLDLHQNVTFFSLSPAGKASMLTDIKS